MRDKSRPVTLVTFWLIINCQTIVIKNVIIFSIVCAIVLY